MITIHFLKAKGLDAIPSPLIQSIAADIDVQIAVARMAEAGDADAVFVG